MNTYNNTANRFTLYAAGLALSAFVIALLAVTIAAGTAQAQTPDNTYPDPQPCGPAAGTAFQPEPHQVTEGHFALFDAYWEWTQRWTSPQNPNKGIMHTNDCPPKMVTVEEVDSRGNVTEITARATSGIDLGEAIMHVENVHQVAVVATTAEVTNGQLSLEEYPGIREALGVLGPNDTTLPVPTDTKVWWLQLDDPDTDADETSDLSIGFSTALFDEKYWLTSAENAPMRYMLETARYENIHPADAPHFFAYEAPLKGNAAQDEPVLDSTRLDVEQHNMRLDPGEYRALQWIFTKPGTYELAAHLQGFVRQSNPHESDEAGYDANWKPISAKYDETSEIKTYVIQVGDKLAETEPPRFGVTRSIHEDASAGAHVGEPVLVFNLEAPEPKYTLSGDDHDHFEVNSRTHPDAAQIVVAVGADLSNRTYDLVLNVSDGKDHEGNEDGSIDHFIGVKIDVIQQTHVFIVASNHTPAVDENVTLKINLWDSPDGVTNQNLSYFIRETSSTGQSNTTLLVPNAESYDGTMTVSQNSAGTYTYTPSAEYTLNGVEHELHGDPVTITWHNP